MIVAISGGVSNPYSGCIPACMTMKSSHSIINGRLRSHSIFPFFSSIDASSLDFIDWVFAQFFPHSLSLYLSACISCIISSSGNENSSWLPITEKVFGLLRTNSTTSSDWGHLLMRSPTKYISSSSRIPAWVMSAMSSS